MSILISMSTILISISMLILTSVYLSMPAASVAAVVGVGVGGFVDAPVVGAGCWRCYR